MTTPDKEEMPTDKAAGPWIVHYGEAVKIKDANGYTVASLSQIHLHGRRSKNEVEKTAQFIVAACNAYEPMREALQGYIDNCTNEQCEHCIAARAALKGVSDTNAKSRIICALHEFSPDGPIAEGTDLSKMADSILQSLTSDGAITIAPATTEAK
jgi:hypothetical protein